MSDKPLPHRDVVPPPGLTLETLERLNEASGRLVTVTLPGEVLLDENGIPSMMGPNVEQTATLVRPIVFGADIERLGGNVDDFPNLNIV